MKSPGRKKLLKELNDLIKELNERQIELFRIWIEHQKYHQENEHKWGIVRLIRKHPGKAIIAALTLGKFLGGYIDIKQFIEIIQKAF